MAIRVVTLTRVPFGRCREVAKTSTSECLYMTLMAGYFLEEKDVRRSTFAGDVTAIEDDSGQANYFRDPKVATVGPTLSPSVQISLATAQAVHSSHCAPFLHRCESTLHEVGYPCLKTFTSWVHTCL